MSEPTPTPWRIVRSAVGTIEIVGANHLAIARRDYPHPTAESDFELIVRAVNLLNESRKVGDANTQPEASADAVLLTPKNPAFNGARDCDENGQTNERRAQRAYTALLSYIGTDRLDETLETHLQDLLNDLMHLACRENIDYNDALRSALNNYQEEK